MDTDSMLRVENRVFVLKFIRVVVSTRRACESERRALAWPAVSMMSQSYSTPLKFMLFENVLSMVG